jgi:hypothetical protein
MPWVGGSLCINDKNDKNDKEKRKRDSGGMFFCLGGTAGDKHV